ncbi:MAG TPA: alpha/beta hydrolase-fold protein [Anaerolineales bacterium]|nr:alpha/beta hydrolase-fold protein [Anaerolineales bacterium]
MKHIRISFLLLLAFVFSSCAPATAETQPAQAETPTPVNTSTAPAPTQTYNSMNMIKMPAPSLSGNLIGEPTERTLYVYLPPSYNTSDQHYPVVYYLPGYSDSMMIGVRLPDDMDALIESGTVREMILVVASGANKLGGGFYVNSPVTGNWEDFIVKDVVGYIDSHFRTLPQAESRGISGHSMGGFGSLNIAMRYPDVFGAVYSLSPGLFDENGLEESLFAREVTITSFIKFENDLAALPLEDAAKRMLSAPDRFTLAYAYAFAPNPDRHPPYFDYPYTEVDGQLVRDDVVWGKWESGFGGIAAEAVQYKDNLLKLKGIVVDYGTADENGWIPKGCVYYGEQLSAAGIPVQLESYNGNHGSQIGTRIRDYMLPYFSGLLKFE